MSPRSWEERLEDILDAIANARSFIEGMSFEDFAEDKKTIRAVAFEIGVIGEAAGRIPLEIRDRYPDVPWDSMQGIRNTVFHEYFRIDELVLWDTVKQDLPPLVPKLEEILERER